MDIIDFHAHFLARAFFEALAGGDEAWLNDAVKHYLGPQRL